MGGARAGGEQPAGVGGAFIPAAPAVRARHDPSLAQHNHPEMLLTERLWRAHLPAGDGPGSEDELAPRGEWANRARAGGMSAPAPPAREGQQQDATGGSLLAHGMAQELKDMERRKNAKHQLLQDWRCEPDGDMDMLRVCGHMDDVRARQRNYAAVDSAAAAPVTDAPLDCTAVSEAARPGARA